MKKLKLIIFMFLLISLLIIFFYGIFGTSISYLSSKEIKENRKLKKDLITELKINNVDAIYEKNTNIYYYMVPEDYENNIYILNLNLEEGFKYKIVGETLNIIKVDYNKQVKIIIYNDKYYYETKIQLTNLPLINITVEEDITTNDAEIVFNYVDSENIEKTIINNAKMHIRGSSSQRFDKKAYKINFYDENFSNEKEISISGFDNSNSIVLDAIYRDDSKIRNMLATQIWNNISDDFTDVDISSKFIELFINNKYVGLYVMTESINRRNLNLNKSSEFDTSVIIKPQDWLYVTSNMNFKNVTRGTYLNYEIKYPNNVNLFSISWQTILSKISNYYDLFYQSTYEVIKSTWNLENYIDLVLFNAFTNNIDNKIVKNNYFYMKSLNDDEVYVQPWDMEYTFGITYKSNKLINVSKNMNDYEQIYTEFYHEQAPEINKLLINRYWELRKAVLTEEYFDSLLDEYKNELSKGAAQRDSELWYEYDVEKEIEDIRTWLHKRLEFFDEYVKSLENE